MANSLLDFVMSLVRDPAAAAQYAADPAQAILAANLTDVTSVDVNHLIPVVAESMSTAVPLGGFDGGADILLDSAHNVWASGAATAAFDAFDDHLPVHGGDVLADQVPNVANVIELPDDSSPVVVDNGSDGSDGSDGPNGFDGLDGLDVPTIETASHADPAFDDLPVHEPSLDASLGASPDDAHHDSTAPHDPGFDIFT